MRKIYCQQNITWLQINLSCNECLNFTESIIMRIKRDEDKFDLVAIRQSTKFYNSVILAKLELEDLTDLFNIINEDALY